MTEPVHPELELQDLLDNRLDATEQARIQAHVDQCARCREELEWLRLARDSARGLPAFEAPADVRRHLVDGLVRGGNEARKPGAVRQRVAYGLGAVAALALIALYFGSRSDLPGAAIRGAEPSTFDYVTSDHTALEQFFSARLSFHTRVFDLAMMSYRLVGGRVGRVG